MGIGRAERERERERGSEKMGMTMYIYAFELLMVTQAIVLSLCSAYQYKVGDLDAWSIPSSANPDVYTKWSKNHIFRVGDSLRKFTFA